MEVRNRKFPLQTVLIPVFAITMVNAYNSYAADFSDVPGIVVAHIPASDGIYFSNPAIAVSYDGSYIVSVDESGPNSNRTGNAVTRIFRSTDGGRIWTQCAKLNACSSSLISISGMILLIGNLNEDSDVVVMKSLDGGKTWTSPTSSETGIIFKGTYRCSPSPITIKNSKLFFSCADSDGPFAMFCPLSLSPMVSNNWTRSPSVTLPEILSDTPLVKSWGSTSLITNASDSSQVIIASVESVIDDISAFIQFDSENIPSFSDSFIRIPGGSKKFTARYDSVSGKYYALTNWVPESAAGDSVPRDKTYNTVALVSSDDLKIWHVGYVILCAGDAATRGFANPNWQIVGDDIVFVAATAWFDGYSEAASVQNPNMITFHTVKNFRELSRTDAYGFWAETNSLEGDKALPQTELKNDGMTNFQRFAFGLPAYSPTVLPSDLSVKISLDNSRAILSYPQLSVLSEYGMKITPYTSRDLKNWTPLEIESRDSSDVEGIIVNKTSVDLSDNNKNAFFKFEIIKTR